MQNCFLCRRVNSILTITFDTFASACVQFLSSTGHIMSEKTENVAITAYKSLSRKRCDVLSMKDERKHLIDQIHAFHESLNVK